MKAECVHDCAIVYVGAHAHMCLCLFVCVRDGGNLKALSVIYLIFLRQGLLLSKSSVVRLVLLASEPTVSASLALDCKCVSLRPDFCAQALEIKLKILDLTRVITLVLEVLCLLFPTS